MQTLPALSLLLVISAPRGDLRALAVDALERDVKHSVQQANPAGFGEVKVKVVLTVGKKARLEITQLPGEQNARLAPGAAGIRVVSYAVRKIFKRSSLGLHEDAFQVKVGAPADTFDRIVASLSDNMAAIADHHARSGRPGRKEALAATA